MHFRRILIAVDDGPTAARAAEAGFGLAGRLKARTALVSVAEPALYAAPDSGLTAREMLAMAVKDGKGILAAYRRGRGRPARLELVAVGKPAAEIVKAAKRWRADLIVLGSHGRRGVRRVLLGSVAEAVMRRAPCPVVVVGPKR